MAETRRRKSDRRVASRATDSLRQRDPDTGAAQEGNGDAVARRAYEIYERRGREHGRDWDDWFHAEQEIRARGSKA